MILTKIPVERGAHAGRPRHPFPGILASIGLLQSVASPLYKARVNSGVSTPQAHILLTSETIFIFMQHYCFWEYAGCIAFWQANRSSRGPIRMQTSGISKLHTGRLQVGYNVGMMQIGGTSASRRWTRGFRGSSYAALLDRCGAGFPVTLLSSGRAAYVCVAQPEAVAA